MLPVDTVLVTGNAVVNGSVSYRFPLSPALIDKKLWIFYFEKLYGCLNMNYGIGVDTICCACLTFPPCKFQAPFFQDSLIFWA